MTYVVTKNAPGLISNHSQGVISNGVVYISGQLPLNPKTEKIESDEIRWQTDRVCQNIAAICKAAGTDIDHVVKTTCYISDWYYEEDFNKIYNIYFKKAEPAKTTVVATLPKGVYCIIDAIAQIEG